MRDRLWETLFYSHTQPPGFNLVAGVLLKLFPNHFAAAAHILFLACGVVITLVSYRLMRNPGVRSPVAAGVTTLFVVSPGVVLFENFFMYEYPLLALLLLAALAWYELFRRPRMSAACGLFAALLALAFIRSIFHFGYLMLIAGVAWYLLREHRRMILTAAALPLLLVFGLYFKNWILYGQFASSTWMGFNIYTISTHQLTNDELADLIRQGKISGVEAVSTLGPLADYAAYLTPEPPRGIPVLDQAIDSTGRTNFNNIEYFQLHRIYLRDGKYILIHRPVAYLRSIVRAWFAYFLPTTDFPFFDSNRKAVRPFERWFNIAVFGQFHEARNRTELREMQQTGKSPLSIALYTGTFLIVGLPLLFLYGGWQLVRRIQRGAWRAPATLLLGFVLFHIAMVTALVNLLSCFENNRYRLPIDGFFAVLAALAVERLIRRWNRTTPAPEMWAEVSNSN